MLTAALVGFGTVGQAVARVLCGASQQRIRLTHICNRNIERKKADWIPADVIWTDDFNEIAASDVNVVIELIGGLSPATEWIRQSLEAGKSVVTANKQVMARHGSTLMALAQQQRRHLLFEASVAGGIPIISGVYEGLAGDNLFRILGILNGTCNYILTSMETEKVKFSDALAEAQRRGYAEADPTADVDGSDAQAKLAILSAVGLRREIEIDQIQTRSIRAIEPIDFIYAKRLGCTVRQVSRVELVQPDNRRILAWVQPALVPLSSALARVEGSQNVVVVEGVYGGETAFSGSGAGGNPTAVAVVSDLESIARGVDTVTTTRQIIKSPGGVNRDFIVPHYIRFIVADRPGIIAALADVFSRHGANIDSVLQEPGWSKAELPFVVTLEACSTAAAAKALAEIKSFDFHAHPPLWMPILTQGERPL